jgi:transcriptional regulator with XRE-family HTH domain
MKDTPLAAALKRARKVKGVSMRELARRNDLEPINISRWESGRRKPWVRMLPLIAKAYGITQEALWALRYPELAAKRSRERKASTSPLPFKRL